MKRHRRNSGPERLEALASQATDYALHMMKTTGSVPPTVIADTDEGFVFCMPTTLTDTAAKDRFADVAKLFAVAYRARAMVMILESWVRLPDVSGHLDPSIRPSEASDRKEMVALLLEDLAGSATCLLPIMRDEQGAFAGLGNGAPLNFDEAEGRFSKLMPRHKPSTVDADKAKHALFVLGMTVENRGFDPTMN